MTTATVRVIGGVVTHGQSHHAAVIDGVGRQLDDRELPASPAAMALCWSGCAVTASLIGSVSRARVPTVSRSLDISAKQVRSSSRSTDRIDGPGGRKASPIPSMPIPLLEPRCPALRRSCRSYVTVGGGDPSASRRTIKCGQSP
jgi:hypothetical protein